MITLFSPNNGMNNTTVWHGFDIWFVRLPMPRLPVLPPRKMFNDLEDLKAQLIHDVRTTSLQRRFSVLTSFQRPYNVVLTSCAGWDALCSHSTERENKLCRLVTCCTNEAWWRHKEICFLYSLFVEFPGLILVRAVSIECTLLCY